MKLRIFICIMAINLTLNASTSRLTDEQEVFNGIRDLFCANNGCSMDRPGAIECARDAVKKKYRNS